MATEGATGLSTTTLDSLLGFVKDGEVLAAARAELAALLADNAALRAALAVVRAELAAQLADAAGWHPSWREAVGGDQPRLAVTIGAMQRIGDALDARRAGGAGEEGAPS